MAVVMPLRHCPSSSALRLFVSNSWIGMLCTSMIYVIIICSNGHITDSFQLASTSFRNLSSRRISLTDSIPLKSRLFMMTPTTAPGHGSVTNNVDRTVYSQQQQYSSKEVARILPHSVSLFTNVIATMQHDV